MSKQLSTFDMHQIGTHILAGSYDKKVLWFDLEGKDTPLKTFSIHSKAIWSTKFSSKFKIFGTCSDDGKLVIQHAHID